MPRAAATLATRATSAPIDYPQLGETLRRIGKLAPFWLRRFTAKIAFLEEARWRFAAKVLWTAGHSKCLNNEK
jgi:hypothetical protein